MDGIFSRRLRPDDDEPVYGVLASDVVSRHLARAWLWLFVSAECGYHRDLLLILEIVRNRYCHCGQQHRRHNLNPHLLPPLTARQIPLGRLLPNYFADRLGPFNIMAPAAACSAVLAFAWIGIRSAPGLIVFCSLYGFTSGSFVSLPAPALATLSPSLNVLGARIAGIGMSFSLTGIGILIGNPIGGIILRNTGGSNGDGWVGLQCWAGASSLAVLVARFAKNPKLLGKA